MAPIRRNKYSNYKRGAVGTRLNVWRGDAHHTSGGLTKTDLTKNATGKIVSKRMSRRAKIMYKRNGLSPKTAEELEDLRALRSQRRKRSHTGHTHYRSGSGGKPHQHQTGISHTGHTHYRAGPGGKVHRPH